MPLTPLAYAIISKHEDAIRLLIELGADINKECYEGGCTAAWVSCWNDKDMIRLLVELGLDVNACGDHRPLFHARTYVNITMMKLLLAHGAYIDSNWGVMTTRSQGPITIFKDFQLGIISRDDLYCEVYGCPPCHT